MECAKLSAEYFAETYATTRLKTKPAVPEYSRLRKLFVTTTRFISFDTLYCKRSFTSFNIKSHDLRQKMGKLTRLFLSIFLYCTLHQGLCLDL